MRCITAATARPVQETGHWDCKFTRLSENAEATSSCCDTPLLYSTAYIRRATQEESEWHTEVTEGQQAQAYWAPWHCSS